MTDILKIAPSAQDGHQELDQFVLRLVVPFALCNPHRSNRSTKAG